MEMVSQRIASQHCVGTHEFEFYALLEQTQDINPYAFENNWPYIVQATRNGFHVFRDMDTIVYYTHRHLGDPQSKTVVVHALGNSRRAAIVKFARQQANQGRSTLLKNVPIEHISWWQEHGFTYPIEVWDEYSRYDDNTFPQYLTPVQHIHNLGYERDHRKAVRQYRRRRTITTNPYEDHFDMQARGLLEAFARHLDQKCSASYIEAVRAHDFFFDRSIQNRIRLQHVEHGELVGCSYFTPVGSIAFYNALINKSEDDLQKYLMHEARSWIAEQYPAITHFVDQGSERVGQDHMKQRASEKKLGDKVHMEMQA